MVFVKQLKQTVQLADFLVHSANAVKWQVWTALLVNLLMRFLAWGSHWAYSFGRLFTFVHAALWLRLDLPNLLQRRGTARVKITATSPSLNARPKFKSTSAHLPKPSLNSNHLQHEKCGYGTGAETVSNRI